MQEYAYLISKTFRGDTPPPTLKHSRYFEPDTNFRWARQRSHCYCFKKRPLFSLASK